MIQAYLGGWFEGWGSCLNVALIWDVIQNQSESVDSTAEVEIPSRSLEEFWCG